MRIKAGTKIRVRDRDPEKIDDPFLKRFDRHYSPPFPSGLEGPNKSIHVFPLLK
jgi:hypothetical protein